MPEPIIIAIVTVLGSVIGSTVTITITRFLDRKKTAVKIRKIEADTAKVEADTADVITNAAGKAVEQLLTPLNERLDELEIKIGEQKCLIDKYGQRVVTLMRGIERLIAQIKSLEHTPVWMPDDWQP